MHKWLKRRLMPFYAPDSGADGSTAGGDNDGSGTETPPDTTDYKALYEKSLADNKKLKASFDQTAHEVAELKKAQKATMTEQQLKEAENAEKEQRYLALQNEVNEMRTATAFAKAGFDEKDYGDIVKKIVEVGGEKSGELADTLIAFVKKANDAAVASVNNALIKDGVVPPKTSTAQKTDNPYATMATQNNQPSNREQEIKEFYKKK